MRAEQATDADKVIGPTRPSPAVSLRARLTREFGDTAVIYTGPGRPVPARAKLAVLTVVGDEPVAKFGRWARAARVPAVVVSFEDDAVFVGPLSQPGRPGCADCARGRRLAAAAATPGVPKVKPAAMDPDETTIVRDDDPDRTTAVPPELITADVGDVEWTGSHGSYTGLLELGEPADPTTERIVALLSDGATELIDHLAEIIDGDVLWHRVIPLPSCEVCGGADGIGTVGLPTGDDPAALMEALAGWVDPLTGVIPWISLKQPLGTGPDLPYVATAAPPHHLDADGVPQPLPIGWGKGPTRCAAIVSAVGEAIERYAPSLPDAGRLVWARPADLDGDVLDPRELPLYEPESYARAGFGFVAFDRRVDHPWVRATWLGTDKPVWVPAVCTYLAMTLLPEHLICQGTSNGLAAGTDAESATARATLELIERDAMMAAWHTGGKGRYVELDDTLDVDLRAIVDALTKQGTKVEVYLLSTSVYGVTAVALAIGDGKRWPGVTLGLGADRSPRAAIRSALMELAQTAPHLATLLRERAYAVPQQAEDVREMLDHAAFYFPADRVVAFDRLRCGGTSRLRDLVEPVPETSVADLAGVLGAANIRVAVVDVTSPDVAMGPFRVIRAVSPDLQPISYGYGNDRSLVPRLRDRALPANRRHVHPIW